MKTALINFIYLFMHFAVLKQAQDRPEKVESLLAYRSCFEQSSRQPVTAGCTDNDSARVRCKD